MFRRILYTTLVDISLPNGPGVNERTFVIDMLARYNNQFHAVIPRPTRRLPAALKSLGATLLPNLGSVRSSGGWIQANIASALELPTAIRSFQPDLIVMRSGPLVIAHYWVSRTSPVPYVLKTVGDVSLGAFYERSNLRRGIRRLSDGMFNQLLTGALCVDVETSALRDLATQVYPHLKSRLHVIDNGVDLDSFGPGDKVVSRQKLGFSSRDLVVGYVGSYPMRRGGKEVVDAVASLRSRENVRGLVVGDSGDANACRQYAASRGVSDSVVVYGEADFAEVPELMAALDVGLSILSGRERMHAEQKVRQYLATGMCVVGTAGSNDFLRGQEFARIVDGMASEEAVNAVASFLRQGREGLSLLGNRARDFAVSNLSFTQRNAERLEIWNALGEAQTSGCARRD